MTDKQYHHNIIKRAMDYVDNTAGEQPKLDEVANAVDLSPLHFQQVFAGWVGVSPKNFQQYLTLNYAKSLVRNRLTSLYTDQNTNARGTSRLHDLFLSWEGMNTEECVTTGQGLIITWGWFDSPFGEIIFATIPEGVCGMGFTTEFGRNWSIKDMQKRWPEATFIKNENALQAKVDAIINGDRANLQLIGTSFQIKVWEALLNIPTGHVTTYTEIAKFIGNPKAVRAVGSAVCLNPISWLIPCHRVLRKSGELGGYHWGLPLKRSLLAWEGIRRDARDTK